jgi:hypothetical protein
MVRGIAGERSLRTGATCLTATTHTTHSRRRRRRSYPAIDQTKFGAGVSDAAKLANVGRRTRELAVTYLPNYLLRAYCHDQSVGAAHGAGQVFDIFTLNYTVAELEAANLWTQMDAKIAGFGGCPHVP